MLSKRVQPLVVVIGASAGGVDALGELLPQLVGAMAVIVVVHLPQDQPSLLVEIFSRCCKLDVKQVEDKEPLLPRSIYFAPPDYHVLIEKGLRLALSLDGRVHHARPSIDVLFQSAADALGAAVCGVLLTGANADGAAGLAAIAHAGGTTIVQDPATAASPEMPSAALALFQPAHVFALNAIAPFLNAQSSTT